MTQCKSNIIYVGKPPSKLVDGPGFLKNAASSQMLDVISSIFNSVDYPHSYLAIFDVGANLWEPALIMELKSDIRYRCIGCLFITCQQYQGDSLTQYHLPRTIDPRDYSQVLIKYSQDESAEGERASFEIADSEVSDTTFSFSFQPLISTSTSLNSSMTLVFQILFGYGAILKRVV